MIRVVDAMPYVSRAIANPTPKNVDLAVEFLRLALRCDEAEACHYIAELAE